MLDGHINLHFLLLLMLPRPSKVISGTNDMDVKHNFSHMLKTTKNIKPRLLHISYFHFIYTLILEIRMRDVNTTVMLSYLLIGNYIHVQYPLSRQLNVNHYEIFTAKETKSHSNFPQYIVCLQ